MRLRWLGAAGIGPVIILRMQLQGIADRAQSVYISYMAVGFETRASYA